MVGGNVVEVSEGGMRIESAESFPVHSVITVVVQFPRHAVRLRARVIWSGGSSESGSSRMGLALTQPEPALKLAYAEWVAEVKRAASDAHSAGAAAPAPVTDSPSPQAAAAPVAQSPPPPRVPEPAGPVRRRLESRQGQSYDALFERQPEGWQLTVVQLPRQSGVGAPDFQSCCPDYASAEKALREFVRTH